MISACNYPLENETKHNLGQSDYYNYLQHANTACHRGKAN